jgi:hypothetical protein
MTKLTLSTALVPPPLLPRPPPPLQPSLRRSDEPLRRTGVHRTAHSTHTCPRTAPPLRARRHTRPRQILGRRRERLHRRARRAAPTVPPPSTCGASRRRPPDVGRARRACRAYRSLAVHRDEGPPHLTSLPYILRKLSLRMDT